MTICIIPARGGSKRIPRKNIKPFFGVPVIAWSIRVAQQASCFDRIIVSTDDTEIAEVALEFGAEVPFIRPEAISDDHAGTTEVIAHAIDHAELRLADDDSVCCVYPTAPLIHYEDLHRGLGTLQEGGWAYVFPICAFDVPVQRAFCMTEAGGLEMLFPDTFATRSQDLAPAYFDAGQFYWGTVKAWRTGARIFAPHSTGLVIPAERVQDIDTPEDWLKAEEKASGILPVNHV